MHFRSRQTALLRLFGITLALLMPLFGVASAAGQANSAIAQEFKVEGGTVTPAALVVLKNRSSNTIELSGIGKEQRLVGVVSDKAAIELSEGDTGVQVVTSGLANALVSDINGTVRTGDKITTSPIEGVGMKATESGVVIGTVQADLTSVENDKRTVTDKAGNAQSVNIGIVPLQVGVAFYSVSDGKESYVPSFLQAIADNIAGRNVSAMRVLVAAIVLLLVVASIASLLYGAVRSSIISIGRNPLSEVAVRKGLFQVALTSFGVLLFAGIAIYLILAL